MKEWQQSARQKEIEEIAREYLKANPRATLAEIARHIGIDPSRLSRLRSRKRITLRIPSTDAYRKRRTPARTG